MAGNEEYPLGGYSYSYAWGIEMSQKVKKGMRMAKRRIRPPRTLRKKLRTVIVSGWRSLYLWSLIWM